ncbi:inner membrane-spanning protein YciB [Henriciella aquimarina]|uniref:inner membrane-spanning protein YciB n=1 Tax=Henriciella aquimarina TaxID=545261 RepID=UPI000A024C4A|nr:septation protein IspZ [Henriciella aquimarina]
MTDEKPGLDTAADKANQIWGDLVPVIGFVLIYNLLRFVNIDTEWLNKETALYWATGVLIVLTVGVIVQKLVKGLAIPPFLIISSTIVGGFGLMGILLQEKSFIYIKPTIQNLFLASIIFGSMAVGQNVWRVMFKQVFSLPDHAWKQLAIRWGLFFVAMALWNEYLWRTYAPGFEAPLRFAGLTIAPAGSYEFLGMTFGSKDAEDVWANWKLGNMVITFIFGAANVPYTLKHLEEEPAADG